VNSMTGFGRASKRDRQVDIEVEARSVNHRFLNVKLGLPEALARFEGEVEKLVRRKMARGSVSVTASIKSLEEAGEHLPDPARIRKYYRRLEAIRKDLGLKGEISFDALLSLPQLWGAGNHVSELAEKYWPDLQRLIGKAVDELVEARAREGEAIRRDVQGRLEAIEACVGKIQERAPAVLASYHRKLDERVSAAIAAKGLEAIKSDLVKEVAIYADKADISEELQRLSSHVEEFRRYTRAAGPIGRKLDFTVQEMVRETNTLSSKSGDAGIAALAVQIKSELEKLKEQAENIE